MITSVGIFKDVQRQLGGGIGVQVMDQRWIDLGIICRRSRWSGFSQKERIEKCHFSGIERERRQLWYAIIIKFENWLAIILTLTANKIISKFTTPTLHLLHLNIYKIILVWLNWVWPFGVLIVNFTSVFTERFVGLESCTKMYKPRAFNNHTWKKPWELHLSSS